MIRVVTAGWSIPRTSAAQLPGEGTHLERYASVLRGAEINSSFYRAHSRKTYENWARQTPRGFLFAVKLPGAITHEQRLRAARKPFDEFLAQVSALKSRLGPLIVQLPPSLNYEPRVARVFFTMLRDRYEGLVACEPRHPSWFAVAPEELLAQFRIARIAADPAVVPLAASPGGWPGLVYYRLHGSPRKYWSVYDNERLAQWARDLQQVPRRTPAWCVFDNTAASGALPNALQVQLLLARRPVNARASHSR
jgi:uncharacterized protein YecE (DUF72 family)